jgi:hypothetical protein
MPVDPDYYNDNYADVYKYKSAVTDLYGNHSSIKYNNTDPYIYLHPYMGRGLYI